MNNNRNRNLLFAVTFLCAAAGFLLPFWPLEVIGVLAAGLFGSTIFAVVVGVLLDLAYGAPVGLAHYLFFPFTLLAVVSVLLRILGKRYLRGKTPPEHL